MTGRDAVCIDGWIAPQSVPEAVNQLVNMAADGRMSTEVVCRRLCTSVKKLGTAVLQKTFTENRGIGGGWVTVLTAAAAARTRRYSLCRVCVELGAEVDQADSDGYAPLLLACCWSHRHVAALLLERGADPTKQANGGGTPADFARTAVRAPDPELADTMELAARDRPAAIQRLWGMDAEGPRNFDVDFESDSEDSDSD